MSEFPEVCQRCGAPWAAMTKVNRDLPVERLQQLATPRAVYECGTVVHEDDHLTFEVPNKEEQSATCRVAEIKKLRGE